MKLNNLTRNRGKALGVSLMVLFLLVSVSCVSKQEGTKEVDLLSYFPFEVGNQWTYQGVGNEYASYNKQVLYKEGNKVQVVEENPGTRLVKIYDLKPDSVVVVYSKEEFYEDENILETEENMQDIILQTPVEIGTIWESGDRTSEIVAKDVTIETPAGTFNNCIQVNNTYKDEENKFIEYYAPGIGLVKSEFIAGETKIISQLENYTIK